jgi:hypothetical protein
MRTFFRMWFFRFLITKNKLFAVFYSFKGDIILTIHRPFVKGHKHILIILQVYYFFI